MAAEHKLTKGDVRMIRFLCKDYVTTTVACSSGDLYREEREEIRRLLRHLPKASELPRAPKLPSDRKLEALEVKLYGASLG